MKRKLWMPIIVVFLSLAVLLVPIPQSPFDDGGTREYKALTYKIVDWNRTYVDGVYEKVSIYFGKNRNKSVDELWQIEEEKVSKKFIATVTQIKGDFVLVEPIEGEPERQSSDEISFSTKNLNELDVRTGSIVEITYSGKIMESYPSQITPISWKIASDLRGIEYKDKWLEKAQDKLIEDNYIFEHIAITKIYSNCFFAVPVIPMPYEIKINGKLSDDWCVGDQITCTFQNTYYDREDQRIETDMLTIKASNWKADPYVDYKPVIYLYPEKELEVSVNLDLDGALTCTYPEYNGGWTVTAKPDGTLTDSKGQTYNYLYWEGETYADYDLSKGFCVKGEDTAKFLEEALEKLGLNRKEANEFIVYWLPLMQNNPYNIISFQTDIYTNAAKLYVNPKPDTLIRVFMAWQKAESFVKMAPQQLTAPNRKGFTAVEWGGTEIVK